MARAVRARGVWIRAAIDPAARGRSQIDGRQLLQMYTDLGLKLDTADNAVEAGILSRKRGSGFASTRMRSRPAAHGSAGAIDPARAGGRWWARTKPPKREGIEFPFHRGFGFGGGGTWMG